MTSMDLLCPKIVNVNQATVLISFLCPNDYKITEVEPVNSNKKPYCRWRVRFVYVNHTLPYAGGETARQAFRDLSHRIPVNAFILGKSRSECPPSYIITYGLRCSCYTNKYADLLQHKSTTLSGFNKTLLLSAVSGERLKEEINFMSPANVDLPETVDWRGKGAVTPIKDERHCGSSWSFSATGAVEGQHFRKSGVPVSLSEQNLIDCSNVDEKDKPKKGQTKTPTPSKKKDPPTDPYENFEFHSPRVPPPPPAISSLSISDVTASSPNLNSSTDDPTVNRLERNPSLAKVSNRNSVRVSESSNYLTNPSATVPDNVNGNACSTFYISDSVDVDSGIFVVDSTGFECQSST